MISGRYSYSSENLFGTSGDDTFDHRGGSDNLYGGSGTDVSLIFDNSNNYTITTLGGVTKVVSKFSAISPYSYSTLTLVNIEKIQFSDSYVTLNTSSQNLIFGEYTYSSEDLFGTSGNDTFDHRGGSDNIYGGSGNDVILIFDNSNNYTITTLGGITKVVGKSSAVSAYSFDTLTLSEVEKIKFSDTEVTLIDSSEPPEIAPKTLSIAENSIAGKALGSMVATDADGDAITYSITAGNTDVDKDGNAAFKINSSTGAITVNDAGDLNYEGINAFALTVAASDGSLFSTATATINLTNVNEAPTGTVSISGSAVQGQVLKVVSTLKDPDGAGTAKVQWLRDGSPISNATSSSYTLTSSDVGKSISARLSYTDGGGFSESRTSSAVVPAGLNPGVSITGSDRVTGEDGDSAVFSVKLDKAPVDPVTITFAVSDATEAKLSASSLTFTSSNWSTAQTLTVTGLDDYDNDGNVAYNLMATVSTNDLSYKRVTVSSIGLTNNNDALDAPIQKTGTNGIDYLKGNNGADRLYGQGDMDDIRGGRGDDRIYGENDDDVLYGDDGNDWVYGGYDDDRLYGGNGDDELYGEAGADRLEGGAGNDYMDGGTGADTMIGGVGNDTYFVDSARDVIDDRGNTTDVDTVIVMATIAYTLAANIEDAELTDTAGAASLTGNTLGNELEGNGSKNTLDGGAGNDVLDGDAGNDTLLGGAGTDILIGGLGTDVLNGGTGDDLVDFTDAAAGFVNVDLSRGTASGDGADTLISIEDVIGSDGADIVVGSTADNELTGGLGNDNLSGGGGSDILYAGTGDDVVDAGDGNDIIIGGDGKGNDKYIGGKGIDTVKYTSATAAITVDLVKGTATSTAGKDAAKIGTDTLSGIENVIAGKYNDIIKGNSGENVLTGGAGSDLLYGGADSVRDVFIFNSIADSKIGSTRDKVYDFRTTVDDLDLRSIDANTRVSGNQEFSFSTTTARANSVWYKAADLDGKATTKEIIVYGDVNGDAKADFEIGLMGVTSLSATDFVL
jgi:Ca2+-binding RTX toxin-like protein